MNRYGHRIYEWLLTDVISGGLVTFCDEPMRKDGPKIPEWLLTYMLMGGVGLTDPPKYLHPN